MKLLLLLFLLANLKISAQTIDARNPPAKAFLQELDSIILKKSKGQIPDWIWTCKNLKYLKIRNAGIEKLPDSFDLLSNLTTLILRRNKLSTLPNSLRNHQQVKDLDLARNKFRVLPDFSTNSSIISIDFWDNEIFEIDLTQIPSQLEILDLQDNSLTKSTLAAIKNSSQQAEIKISKGCGCN